ncbi:hypothetical protein [Neorhodopirellula lusitana]|uniref:hypothetical protein n=1 Tax=Neorhodopirellula lusitana TaxID=445327 RepID=UPI0038512047
MTEPSPSHDSADASPMSASQESYMASQPLESLVIAPGNVRPGYLLQADSDNEATGDLGKMATLSVLFFVTTAFGLPVLWRNPRFATWERWLWSIIVVVYTILVVCGMIWWVRQTIEQAQGF